MRIKSEDFSWMRGYYREFFNSLPWWMLTVWIISGLASLGLIGLIAWAIIRVVFHYT